MITEREFEEFIKKLKLKTSWGSNYNDFCYWIDKLAEELITK